MSKQPQTVKILGISGSIRKESWNTTLLRAIKKQLLPANATLELYDISKIPIYNQDLEREPNEELAKFKAAIRAADAILFSTPEYNYGVPGGLKNAIDAASRPYGDNAFQGKTVSVVSASMGPAGGARAQTALRPIIGGLGLYLLPGIEVAVGEAHTRFDKDGNLTNDFLVNALRGKVQDLVNFTIELRIGKAHDKN